MPPHTIDHHGRFDHLHVSLCNERQYYDICSMNEAFNTCCANVTSLFAAYTVYVCHIPIDRMPWSLLGMVPVLVFIVVVETYRPPPLP
jgi:hypothetical protein